MKTNFNLLLIAIQVISINEEMNMADINVAYSEPNAKGGAKKWHRIDLENVFITGRAIKKLKDPNELQCEIGKVYQSLNNSKSMAENPFALVRKHKVDSDGNSSVMFYLKCVEENGSYLEERTMPNGDVAYTRIWKKNKPDYMYLRYIDQYDKQKAYHDARIAEQATA